MLSRHANVATDPRGNSLAAATVTIRRWDGATVPIYQDRNGTTPYVGGVITTDPYGNWGFFAAPGYYKATISKIGYTTTIYDDILLAQIDATFDAKYFGIVDGVDVSFGLLDWAGELEELGGGIIVLPVLFTAEAGDVDLHPSVSMEGPGRGICKLKRKAGANYVIKSLARARGNAESDGYFPFFEHFTIDGRKGLNPGINTIPSLWFEPITADPNYGTFNDKGYCGGRVVDVEVLNSAGIGIYVQSGRKRFYIENSRAIEGASKGLLIGANDPVVGARCGFGGNDEHQIMFSAISGALMHGVNVWGGNLARSNDCLAVHFQNINGGEVTGCVLQDTLSINQTTSDFRGITIVGNHFKPHEQDFVSDGVPVGSADESCNAWIRVRGGKNVIVGPNDYTRSSENTRFKWLLTCTDAAVVAADISSSSDPNVQPWAATDPVPILIDGSSNCEYQFTDVYSGYRRTSARVIAGLAHGAAVPAGYDFVAGGLNPSLFANRVHMQRGFSLLPGTAQEFESMSTSSSKVIVTNRARVTFYANTDGVATYGITLPDTPDPGHELELVFEQGVEALTWTMGSPGHHAFSPFSPAPARIAPGTVLRLTYKPSSETDGEWWVLIVSRDNKMPRGTVSQAMVNSSFFDTLTLNKHVHLTRASVCTAFDIRLPSAPEEDEIRRYTVHNGITALTITPRGGKTLHTTDTWPTTVPAGGNWMLEVQHIGGVWYCNRAG